MKTQDSQFDLHKVLHDLKHYLPAQAPLKDFIHHNTLHAFQDLTFFEGLRRASEMLGYKISLTPTEYQDLYRQGRIKPEILRRIVVARKGSAQADTCISQLLLPDDSPAPQARIGRLRHFWKTKYQIDLDTLVHPALFRILCSYLDQGISMWDFPVAHAGFLASIRELERHSFTSFFKTKRARTLLKQDRCAIPDLLAILVGKNQNLYTTYLFDQQFAHQGWSGLVATVESEPQTLLDRKHISLHDLITLELLLEIDTLDSEHGTRWAPLETCIDSIPQHILAPFQPSEWHQRLAIWQEAYEWSYYDHILAGIQHQERVLEPDHGSHTFQAMFCIDDRECSFRRYLEREDPKCETFGTPGFFGVEFYFKPEGGKFYTKLCPAPVTPRYLIKELGSQSKRKKDLHLAKNTHSLARGWLITQTLGFWSALRLFGNIVRPTTTPASASSFLHMDKVARLTIENLDPTHVEDGLQVGFTIEEMTTRVEGLLKSIGLVKDFAPIVYVVGHGSSSVNNPHYAAYDCGACCGRPGSVNARVICHMANNATVRRQLAERGIHIPARTQFVGGLHDTTRDEVVFYDEDALSPANLEAHLKHLHTFDKALDANAKERSRRLELVDSRKAPKEVHKALKMRSVSLFEPRPELNHATNALCVVGRRALTRHLFLDRRSFLNSYDYQIDPEGKYLFNILKAAAPVCGGINLEYFFSRVDNQKLGAGSKLPHNVMGLFGVANGAEGDLRPGLPNQMIEVHDPVRLMLIVEHRPDIVLDTIQRHPDTYQWFINEWVHLVVVDPEQKALFHFKEGAFHPYEPLEEQVPSVQDLTPLLEKVCDNLPAYQII